MASSAAVVAELDDDDHHHDEDLEHRLSGDRLLADEEPLVLDSVISTDVSSPVMRHKRWLLYLAAASSLLCMFTINFDLLFLSTNYSKRIASDLHQLSNAVWIILVGSITETASQPVYAYLSNNQGRKRAFLLAASLTAIGFLLCSLSTRLLHLVLSRFVVGSGCAGVSLVVTIIINDNVPLKDFALWRSLLIFVQMAGDVSGGPLGSAIADASSWQAVYGIETIVMLCGLVGTSFSLAGSRNQSRDSPKPRLDLLQTLLLFVTIALPLFALNLGGDILPWSHPVVIVLFSCTPVALGGLILVTINRSENSSMIKKLLDRSAILALFTTTFFVVYAFNSLTYNMAVYIEARSFNNPSTFGDWALSCIFLSRPFGTFLAGLIIKRYRSPWILLRWNMIVWFFLYILATSGTMPLENPATAPCLLLIGLSLGVFESSLIVSLFGTVQKKEQASFLAAFNVVVAFAGDVGVGVSLALTQNFLRRGLHRALVGMPNAEEVISKALESLDSIRNIPLDEQSKIIEVYKNSIEKVWAISCVTLLIGIVATMSQRAVYRDESEPGRNDHVHAG
ncbi:MFS general substrate transporter [Annulohypoxylon maeteangense]|uniref:MFS general substrate transporter n=1 Tax=Annulohypoxylon maeteangense TaxID=1927788 RepID=UPI00200851C8|nr:MFS general substrate transporter [Annulohypoxylon maeteangense]KAI0885080.1 MFS general substrate transporter [Annulohypoxylon maeteangense]